MKHLEILLLRKKNKTSIFLSMILVLLLYSLFTNSNSPLVTKQKTESTIQITPNTEKSNINKIEESVKSGQQNEAISWDNRAIFYEFKY